MDISDFRTFLEVSRTRHFGQAAKNLCITQSAVSARIKQLEDQLGTTLFVRERNNIQLTPAGERMLAYAELITTAWQRARQELGVHPDQIPFVLGGIPGLWDINLQQWLQRLTTNYKQLVVHVETHGNDTLLRRVLNNTMELAFVFEAPQSDTLNVQEIDRFRLLLVSAQPQSLNAALSDNYILVDWGTSFLSQHAQHFPDLAAPSLHISLGRIALEYIISRGGSAYLAEPMVADLLQQQRLHAIADAPVIERPVYAIYNNHNQNAPLIQQLLA